MMETEERYLKLREVADRLQLSERSVRRLVQEAGLPAYKIGGTYRVNEGDLKAYLERHRVKPDQLKGD